MSSNKAEPNEEEAKVIFGHPSPTAFHGALGRHEEVLVVLIKVPLEHLRLRRGG